MSETPPEPVARKSWPDYRAVWRWHFYAGLLSAPFVILLSITGAIYLFKPQVEAWQESPYDHLVLKGTPAAPADQVRAALAAFPGSTASAYELPPAPDASARISLRQNGQGLRVYVHPETLAVLQSVPEDQRLMRQIFRLHGELWMGDRGSNIVEIAASWTIIMLATGLYLWWPRNAKGLGGVLYPRLRKGTTIFWRDLHSVTGIWVSALALFLLVSGLPWAKFWGSYFKEVRQATGTAVAQQDWTVGSERSNAPAAGGGGEHGGHSEHGGGGRTAGGRRGGGGMPKDLAPLNTVVAAASTLNLPHPVLISGPTGDAKGWTVKSNTPNRPQRVDLVLDGTTGAILSRSDFKDRHWIDRVVGHGIAAHEGQLFGWPNQLLGLLTVIGLVLLSVSGIIMWWRRRDTGVLGAPKILLNPRWSFGLLVLVILFGVYLPLFGASLVAVWVLERVVLSRIPSSRRWLGLERPGSLASACLLLALFVPGCGGSAAVSGGTPGVLKCGERGVSDIQLTLYRAGASATDPVGFAQTKTDGAFELLAPKATAPLWLPSGEYVCTLESAGAPVQFPKEYAKPETTPLKVAWDDSQKSLSLSGPAVKLP